MHKPECQGPLRDTEADFSAAAVAVAAAADSIAKAAAAAADLFTRLSGLTDAIRRFIP